MAESPISPTPEPLVSVITPTRNRCALLRDCIESVLAQDYPHWEMIAVDDCSSDQTAQTVRTLADGDPRIKLLTGTVRAGGSAARNRGLAAAAGSLVVFLDDDDLLARHCLSQRVRTMQSHPELAFAIFPTMLFRDTPGDTDLLWNADTAENDIDRYLRKDIPWGISGPIWRREALDRVGPWDERALSGQDWEFHLRALILGLPHRRFSFPDAYCRLRQADRPSIGSSAVQPEHQRRRALMIDKIHTLLGEHRLLTSRRRRLLAGQQFRVAMRLTIQGERRDGLRVWLRCGRARLITPRLMAEGLLYMRLWHRRGLRRIVYPYLRMTWPRDVLFIKPPTHMNTRLSAQASRARGMAAPRVSVVLAVYNQERYIGQALDSVIAQTFGDWELIVVDDGSTDGTARVIDERARRDPRIRVIRRPNTGTVRAVNEGLAISRGEYVARMDGDDVCHPERLARQVALLDARPEVLAVGCRLELIDPFGLVFGYTENPLDHEAIDAALLEGRGGTVPQPAATIRRAALMAAGGYRPQYENSEDLDLWLRLAEVGRLANLPGYLLQYRRHPLSISHAKHDNQMRMKALIVGEAYDRRGLPRPAEWSFRPWHPKPVAAQLLVWGWRALKGRNIKVARTYALDLVRMAPLSAHSWRLMACALRGY